MSKLENRHIARCFFNAIQNGELSQAADYLTDMVSTALPDYRQNDEATKAFILAHLIIAFDLSDKMGLPEIEALKELVANEMREYHQKYEDYPDSLSLMLHRVMQKLSLTCGLKPADNASRVEEIRQYITSSYANQDLSVSSLGDRFNISVSHLSRIFKKYTGINLNDYIRMERITRSQELLRRTDEPIGDIGLRVGFSSGSAFIRAYREKTGVTPGFYRQHSRTE